MIQGRKTPKIFEQIRSVQSLSPREIDKKLEGIWGSVNGNIERHHVFNARSEYVEAKTHARVGGLSERYIAEHKHLFFAMVAHVFENDSVPQLEREVIFKLFSGITPISEGINIASETATTLLASTSFTEKPRTSKER